MKLRESLLTLMSNLDDIDTNFGRFKMLALRTMAGDEYKDVNNATSLFKEFDYVLHVCGFVRPKSTMYRISGL